MAVKPIVILIADDRDITVAGLRSVLSTTSDMEIIGEARTAPSAVSETLKLKPDILIIDLKFQDNEDAGINAIQDILKSNSHQKIIALTNWPHLIRRAEQAGAATAVSKDISAQDLLDLIRSIYTNDPPTKREWPDNPSTLSIRAKHDIELTQREQQVLRHLADGKTAAQIGFDLGISQYTVRNHIRSILTKLGAANATEAIHLAYRYGLL